MRRKSLLGGRLRRLVVLPLLGVILLYGVSMKVTARPTRAATPLNLLNNYNGGVIENPQIYNLFLDENWDADNPPVFHQDAIDGFTQQLLSSGYFASAHQYGVNTPSFAGSHDAHTCLPPIIDGFLELASLELWMTCETAVGPDPFIRPTLTGVATPSDNTLYVIYLPTGVSIGEPGFHSCGDYQGFHFLGVTTAWQYPRIDGAPLPPVVGPQQYAWEVVPVECAKDLPKDPVSVSNPYSFDDLTMNVTHEMIEAMTDPILGFGWIEKSLLSFDLDVLTTGEAADICQAKSKPSVQLPDGLTVAPYWSNADAACMPIVFTLGEGGIPQSLNPTATWNGQTVALRYSVVVDPQVTYTYTFPSPVNDPNPGIRYVTDTTSGTVNLAQSYVLFAIANYNTEYYLTTQVSPAAAAAGDASLTPSAWEASGSTVTLTTDPLVATDASNRYRFDHWSGDASGTLTTTSVLMDAPKTATANYVLQHLLVVTSSGLGANSTTITDGATTLGSASASAPLVVWLDDGPLALGASANVNGIDGTQYFFQGFTPAPPATLTAPFTTTAAYETMAQLIASALTSGGIVGPGASGLADSYTQQFAAVQADMGSQDYAQALGDLQSFISHVQAQCCTVQAGKHLTAATAQTFQLAALLVYHNAVCLALTAGQIDATMASLDDGYYRALVASLGGTVLLSC